MLEITNLHKVLFTLSINSHGFTFVFFKRLNTNEYVFLTYKQKA